MALTHKTEHHSKYRYISYVYAVRRADGDIKIGYSWNVGSRIANIRSKHGEIDVLGVMRGGRPDLTPAIDAVNTLAAALSDAQARVDEFTGAAQAADSPELLDEADEADLIEVLRLEHADIAEAALGVTQFLLNVIARLRTTATVAAPY